MISIFIIYPQKQYYLAHIYEQFLANELIAEKYGFVRGTIGNGIIYLQVKKQISIRSFISIADNYRLKKEYFQSIIQQIQKETLKNLDQKTTYECVHFQARDVTELKKILNHPPSQKQFEIFAQKIAASRGIWIIDEEKEKMILCGSVKINLIKTKIPFKIQNNTLTEFSYQAIAKNIADAFVYSAVSNKLKIKNYLWLAEPKRLVLTFKITHRDQLCSLNGQIINLGQLEYKSQNLIDKIWQKLEWGKALSIEQINQYLSKVKKIKINILKNKIDFELIK